MAETSQNKAKSGRFKPGVSGNPGGRRRRSEADRAIDDLARTESEAAFRTVAELVGRADSDRTRLAAALAILERAHGKPGERLPDPIDLPAGATLAEQGQAITAAACRGDITPTQASALLSCLSGLARLVEITDLQQRIERLEGKE